MAAWSRKFRVFWAQAGQIVGQFGHAEKLFQIEKHRINQWNMLLQTNYYR